MKRTTLVFAPPALALCFLFGFWLRWIPGHGIGDAFDEFLMALFLCELWSVPFAAFLAFATILFFAGRIIWMAFSFTWNHTCLHAHRSLRNDSPFSVRRSLTASANVIENRFVATDFSNRNRRK